LLNENPEGWEDAEEWEDESDNESIVSSGCDDISSPDYEPLDFDEDDIGTYV